MRAVHTPHGRTVGGPWTAPICKVRAVRAWWVCPHDGVRTGGAGAREAPRRVEAQATLWAACRPVRCKSVGRTRDGTWCRPCVMCGGAYESGGWAHLLGAGLSSHSLPPRLAPRPSPCFPVVIRDAVIEREPGACSADAP